MNALNKFVETIIVTPEQASMWLQQCPFPNQRPITQEWVTELAGLLRSGEWEGGMIKLHQVGDHWLLVDGHHRLLAISESGMSAWLHVERTLNSTMEQAKAAYWRTDENLPRSFRHAMKAGGFHLPHSDRVMFAARFIENGYRDAGNMHKLHSSSNKLRIVQEWQSEAEKFLSAIRGVPKSISGAIRTAGPLAVGLTLFRYDPEDADAFFRTLALNSGLKRGDPVHALLNFLSNPELKKRNQAYRARGVAHCWNTWKEGAALVLVRPTEDAEMRLVGTPIGKKTRR